MSALTTRLRFGSLMTLLVAGMFWADKDWKPLSLLLLPLAAMAAQLEFYGMAGLLKGREKFYALMSAGLGFLIYGSFFCPEYNLGAAVTASVAALLLAGVLRSDTKDSPAVLGVSLLGLLTIPLMLGLAGWLRLEYGWHWLVFLIAVAKAGDSCAYFAGTAMGRHKLIPKVSPNKSWEGAVASVIGSLLVAWWVDSAAFPPELFADTQLWVVAAVLVNLGGQFGDLSESLLKRGCNTKDSAGLIPVMGGFYDLVDSFLLASPALAAWLLIAHA
ncbi:MAG: phosphatidate cytidylyltransferase [Planctomycetes bacterium]|nr:phosphatidate cytidylyltransferase [Planctomycetota bacterium]